jgi:hypothetical protein
MNETGLFWKKFSDRTNISKEEKTMLRIQSNERQANTLAWGNTVGGHK